VNSSGEEGCGKGPTFEVSCSEYYGNGEAEGGVCLSLAFVLPQPSVLYIVKSFLVPQDLQAKSSFPHMKSRISPLLGIVMFRVA
jgi:hypothetical protein